MKTKTYKRCGTCPHIGRYEDGVFARNPHCCCELMWELFNEDYRVDKNTLDENCPLKSEKLREGIAEIRKAVRR